jgi:hypothetical protein
MVAPGNSNALSERRRTIACDLPTHPRLDFAEICERTGTTLCIAKTALCTSRAQKIFQNKKKNARVWTDTCGQVRMCSNLWRHFQKKNRRLRRHFVKKNGACGTMFKKRLTPAAPFKKKSRRLRGHFLQKIGACGAIFKKESAPAAPFSKKIATPACRAIFKKKSAPAAPFSKKNLRTFKKNRRLRRH